MNFLTTFFVTKCDEEPFLVPGNIWVPAVKFVRIPAGAVCVAGVHCRVCAQGSFYPYYRHMLFELLVYPVTLFFDYTTPADCRVEAIEFELVFV